MRALLFKDVTASETHATTAIGNQGKPKPKKKPKPAAAGDGEENIGADVDKFVKVLKVDTDLGLVFGWAIVCKIDGKPYFDKQDDHIPEDAMLSAAVDFVGSGSLGKEMHTGGGVGTIAFVFPLTAEVAKAFDLTTATTGLMVAMKPDNADVLTKFRDGTYTGFSIGGSRGVDEDA